MLSDVHMKNLTELLAETDGLTMTMNLACLTCGLSSRRSVHVLVRMSSCFNHIS